jgi:hypothetical protein
MDDVPPDLSRLGQELSTAIDRSLRRQRLRRRLVNRAAKVGMSGALIFVAMTPAVLQPASVGIEEEQRMIEEELGMEPWPDSTATVSRICEPSHGICTPQIVVASVNQAAEARIPPKLLVGSRSPSNAP